MKRCLLGALTVVMASLPAWAQKKTSDLPARVARRTPVELVKMCDQDGVHRCFSKVQVIGAKSVPMNCLYGWWLGLRHPSTGPHPVHYPGPPEYRQLLNGLDQCAYFHDKGAFRYNQVTGVCETDKMCASTTGFFRCANAWPAQTAEEKGAKKCVLDSLFAWGNKICIPALYKGQDVQFEKKPDGHWLTAASVARIWANKKKCHR